MIQIPSLNYEFCLWGQGVTRVAGLDEAGRGAWAGPVYAAAVILPPDPAVECLLDGVRDSKQMTPQQRQEWVGPVRAAALDWAVGFATNEEIDAINILNATRLAMQRALASLSLSPQHLLLDAVRLPVELPQTAIIHGDACCLSIAAASVLAKTGRDARMAELDEEYPNYGFGKHKGYGTRAHQQALASLGPCAIHRRSYAPLR